MLDPKFNELKDLIVHELQDLYDAEHRLLEALPQMAEAAHDAQLKQAFSGHLRETEGQVQRLESVFRLFNEEPARGTCKAMKGLIKEGEESIKASGDPVVNDLALIAAAQRVEHYEMAGYGAARTMADIIGQSEAADYLQATLDEEGGADHRLIGLAKQLYQHAA